MKILAARIRDGAQQFSLRLAVKFLPPWNEMERGEGPGPITILCALFIIIVGIYIAATNWSWR